MLIQFILKVQTQFKLLINKSLKKVTQQRNQSPEDTRRQRRTKIGRGGVTMDMEGPTTGEPPRVLQGPGRRTRYARGGSVDAVNGVRRRHAVQGI